MPGEIRAAIERAKADDDIHVIVLRGAGPGFCGGYDLKQFAEAEGPGGGAQDMPWDLLANVERMEAEALAVERAIKPRGPNARSAHGRRHRLPSAILGRS